MTALDVLLSRKEDDAEIRTRDALLRLVENYDLEPWTFTNVVLVDRRAVPHSHPVLTINTSCTGDALLAMFVHEQLHWFEERHADVRDRVVEETRLLYPEVPVGGPDGGVDEFSTRLHLIVCYWERMAMERLVGPERAAATLGRWRHYRWVYGVVLSDASLVAALLNRHNLIPPGLRDRLGEP